MSCTKIDTIRIDHDDASWQGIRYFDFTIDLPLDEVIGNVDSEGNYSIQFTFTSKWRWVYGHLPELGIESIDGNPNATLNEIRAAEVKYLTFHYTGAELNSLATNDVLHFHLKVSSGQSGQPWDSFVKINNIRVTQTFENTTVPLAMRSEKGYGRGYNGQIKLESVSGRVDT